jgi:hypothetical protein
MRIKQPQTDIVVAVADLHCGSTVGLCPPAIELDDGGTYRASPAQMQLWKCWLDLWQNVVPAFKKLHTAKRVITVIAGDAVEGVHHGTTQLISANKKDQNNIAVKVIEPIAQASDKSIYLSGTPSHTGAAAEAEERLAQDFDNTIWRTDKSAVWKIWRGSVQGVVFNIAHHRPQNHKPWTAGGAANRQAAQLVYDYTSSGDKMPNIVLRAHGHKVDSSGDFHLARHGIQVIYLPAWQLKTEYIHKIQSGDALSDIGAYLFACKSGEYDKKLKRYPIKGERECQVI